MQGAKRLGMTESLNAELPTGAADRAQEYISDVTFDELGLSPELRKAIAERGYVSPTPVQAKAWAPTMAGKDLIVRSKTGTGKTAAFGMPIIDRIPMGTREVKALMLCPTRELAMQVANELEELAKYRDISVTAIYGGASMQTQMDALKRGSAIIVGTPGRVHDLIRRGNLKLNVCSFVVLDEADEMLNQGFYEEVTRILDFVPAPRQVLLFSATVPEDIQRLIAKYTTEPETLLLSGDVYTVDHINHVRYEISDHYPKPRNLLYVLELEDPDNAIIFCNTRDDTELVTAVLNRNGFDAEMLNGDLAQKERERVMGRVKRGELAFMVATDLAARGIDISDLGHVINYSLPEDAAVYLHRVGRTGRIGKKGTAINLTSGRELATLTTLEKKYGIKFEIRQSPTAEEATRMWANRHISELKEAAQGSIYESFLQLAGELKTVPNGDALIAFLLKYFFSHRRMERAQGVGAVEAAAAPPVQQRVTRERDKEWDREGGGKRSGGRPERGGGRGERGGGRGERGSERRERPPRSDEVRGSSARASAPPATATGGDRAAFEQHQAEAPAAAAVRAERPRREEKPRGEGGGSNGGKKKLSDRELFELLQAGKPLPPVDDPTASSGSSEAGGEHRERRPRGERGERRERRPRTDEAPPAEVVDGQVRMWLNLGKMDNLLDDAAVVSTLETMGAPSGKVAKTELRGSYSYVHVAEADAPAFEALGGKSLNSKALRIERARR
jgi:ATP-dependent RNA helicase DeaD